VASGRTQAMELLIRAYGPARQQSNRWSLAVDQRPVRPRGLGSLQQIALPTEAHKRQAGSYRPRLGVPPTGPIRGPLAAAG